MDKKCVYTIGYTLFQCSYGIDIEKMFGELKALQVNYLVDVRSVPFSRQYPQCNADNLKYAGEHYGVNYIHMPEVGAKASEMQEVFSKASDIFYEEEVFPIAASNRPESTELKSYEEIVDFSKFRHDEYFIDGLKRIKKACERDYTIALMCSEKYPMDCHRYFLISRALEERYGDWIEVRHIIKDSRGMICTITNEELNRELENKILNRHDVRALNIQQIPLVGDAPIEKYAGESQQERIADFCDRYWNLMHGWKRVNYFNNNRYEDYD